MATIQETIIKLNEQLKAARHAYYVLAEPTLSDATYDALEKELKDLVAANPLYALSATVLTKVGSDIKAANGARIKHLRPMLSIENKYTKDDVVVFFLGLQEHGLSVPPTLTQ